MQEKARENLARKEDPDAYDKLADTLFKVRNEVHQAWDENLESVAKAQEAADKSLDLHREVAFLKKYLEQFPPNTPRMRIPSDLNDSPRAPSPPSPTPRCRQYAQYMEQEIARGHLALNRNAAMFERIRDGHGEILDKSAALEREKARLLKKAGVRSTADIPGLIPNRVYSPQVNFDEDREGN